MEDVAQRLNRLLCCNAAERRVLVDELFTSDALFTCPLIKLTSRDEICHVYNSIAFFTGHGTQLYVEQQTSSADQQTVSLQGRWPLRPLGWQRFLPAPVLALVVTLHLHPGGARQVAWQDTRVLWAQSVLYGAPLLAALYHNFVARVNGKALATALSTSNWLLSLAHLQDWGAAVSPATYCRLEQDEDTAGKAVAGSTVALLALPDGEAPPAGKSSLLNTGDSALSDPAGEELLVNATDDAHLAVLAAAAAATLRTAPAVAEAATQTDAALPGVEQAVQTAPGPASAELAVQTDAAPPGVEKAAQTASPALLDEAAQTEAGPQQAQAVHTQTDSVASPSLQEQGTQTEQPADQGALRPPATRMEQLPASPAGAATGAPLAHTRLAAALSAAAVNLQSPALAVPLPGQALPALPQAEHAAPPSGLARLHLHDNPTFAAQVPPAGPPALPSGVHHLQDVPPVEQVVGKQAGAALPEAQPASPPGAGQPPPAGPATPARLEAKPLAASPDPVGPVGSAPRAPSPAPAAAALDVNGPAGPAAQPAQQREQRTPEPQAAPSRREVNSPPPAGTEGGADRGSLRQVVPPLRARVGPTDDSASSIITGVPLDPARRTPEQYKAPARPVTPGALQRMSPQAGMEVEAVRRKSLLRRVLHLPNPHKRRLLEQRSAGARLQSIPSGKLLSNKSGELDADARAVGRGGPMRGVLTASFKEAAQP